MPDVNSCRASLFFEEAGSGGTPVLLLHELDDSSESWREVIALLAPDRRVQLVRHRLPHRADAEISGFHC